MPFEAKVEDKKINRELDSNNSNVYCAKSESQVFLMKIHFFKSKNDVFKRPQASCIRF